MLFNYTIFIGFYQLFRHIYKAFLIIIDHFEFSIKTRASPHQQSIFNCPGLFKVLLLSSQIYKFLTNITHKLREVQQRPSLHHKS